MGKKQIIQVQQLTKSIGDENVSREKQISNVLELQNLHPDIIQGYNEENLAQADLVKIKEDLNKKLLEEFINRRKIQALRVLDNELQRAENRKASQQEIDNIKRVGEAKIKLLEDEFKRQLGLQEDFNE